MTSDRMKKFESVVSDEQSNWNEKAKWHYQNKDWLEKSAHIAVRVLEALDEKNMSQKELAELMDVSPQYISKIVKGHENLSLETITKLENALGIVLFKIENEFDKENFTKTEIAQLILTAITFFGQIIEVKETIKTKTKVVKLQPPCKEEIPDEWDSKFHTYKPTGT